MSVRSIIKHANVAVGASQTNLPVSLPFPLPQMGPAHVRISLSAASVTNGITFELMDSWDGGTTYQAIGDQSQAAVTKKTFTQGVREVSNTTWPAETDATQADYLHVTAQDGTTFAVWLNIDGDDTEPSGALYLAADETIEVAIASDDTAAVVAAAARAAVVANAEWAARFTTGAVSTASFTVTQILGGAVTDPAPKSADDGGAGSITVSVTTAGTDGASATNLSTNTITSTSHGFATGTRLIYGAGTAATGGLTDGGIYYAIAVDANSLKLATSLENALAGTAVDLTSFGVGTGTLYAADYEIRMIKEDTSDLAQMPFVSPVIVAVDSGASDSCTVSAVYLSE